MTDFQPIDSITAAALRGETPAPCEPTVEIPKATLTRLLDVVEFGDQLERVERDRLLNYCREVLALEQPELWATWSPGPNELFAWASKEDAQQHVDTIKKLVADRFPGVPISIDVIPSPYSPLEHFENLAEMQHERIQELEAGADDEATVTMQMKLPCEIKLPGGMKIGKGCTLKTLMTALRNRGDDVPWRQRFDVPVPYDPTLRQALERALSESPPDDNA